MGVLNGTSIPFRMGVEDTAASRLANVMSTDVGVSAPDQHHGALFAEASHKRLANKAHLCHTSRIANSSGCHGSAQNFFCSILLSYSHIELGCLVGATPFRLEVSSFVAAKLEIQDTY